MNINERSLLALKAASWQDGYVRPLYHSYCFSNIPGTVLHLFGEASMPTLPSDCFEEKIYDTVVVFLIDAFGWVFFEKYGDKYPFLKRFLEEGRVSKLTSQFPSTTAAHVTALHTGLDVGQSGIYEWFHYDPSVDRVIAPLLFSYARDRTPSTLKGIADPKEVYPQGTIYQKLQKKGIPSTVFHHQAIAKAPYSKAVLEGAEVIAYKDLKQGLKALTKAIPKRGYFYFYFGDIDSQGHRHGTTSKEMEEAIDYCFTSIEQLFWQKVNFEDQEIALIVTADHGMIDVDPAKTFYLNQQVPEITQLVEKTGEGGLKIPAGSCRDFFFHAAEGKRDEAHAFLQQTLKSIADVYTTEQLAEEGFFGRQAPSDRFWDRVGDLVILPKPHETVWWYEKGHFEMHFYGMHGGLTPNEMETIFLFL